MSTPRCPPLIDESPLTLAALRPVDGEAPLPRATSLLTAGDTAAEETTQPPNSPPLRVLLVEDNSDDASLMAHTLAGTQTRFQVCWVKCLAKARERLLSEPFDAIITDLSLPDSKGVETVIAIRQCAATVPLLVLTGLSSDPVALEALKRGAQDYLTKGGATSDVLDRAIRYAIQRQRNAEMEQLLKTVRASEHLLARKNKRLARLYRTAHRFVDNVSHEFRTPLTVIMENVSIVRDGLVGDLNAKQLQLLDVSVDRTDDLNNMVNDMLDVSRLSAGILGLYRCSCRMEQIVEHVRPNLLRKAANKSVTIEIEIDSALPTVYCDPEKIGRVLINLAGNAIKFSSRPGHVRIHVGVDPLVPQVVTSISDTGPGIDPKRLGELFKRFKQLGTESSASTKGFGLGLNIAKDLVHLNFGEIRVESQVGVGSTFAFTVPIDDPLEVTRRYLGQVKKGLSELSLLEARVDASIETTVADDVNAFLNRLLRRRDILFRADPKRWVLLLSASEAEVQLFLARSQQMLVNTNRNRPFGPLPEMVWSRIGTWQVRQGEILDAVRAALAPEATCQAESHP
jgi:signal transduction histidine kinase